MQNDGCMISVVIHLKNHVHLTFFFLNEFGLLYAIIQLFGGWFFYLMRPLEVSFAQKKTPNMHI